MISTARHVEYALGYLGLGLPAEAAAELAAIPEAEHATPAVLGARLELHLARKQWRPMLALGRQLTEIAPEHAQGWVLWAYALRELNQVEAARAVLQRGQPLHGEKYAIFHYNLACYHCLLGELAQARTCLTRACRMDPSFKETALEDSDLATLHGEIATMRY